MKYRLIPCGLFIAVLIGCAGLNSDKSTGLDVAESSPGEVYVQLGIQYLERNQLDVALKNLKRALELDSRNSEAHNAIAILYERLDQPEQSLEHFRRAVSLRPTNASAQNNYGRILCSLGKYNQAEEHFEKAINTRLYQRPWLPLTNAGRCARLNDDLEKADRYLRQALKLQEAFPPALIELAEVKFKSKNYLSVRAFLQRYHSASEQTATSLWLAVQSENALGNSEAVNHYSVLLQKNFPASEEVRLMELAFPGTE